MPPRYGSRWRTWVTDGGEPAANPSHRRQRPRQMAEREALDGDHVHAYSLEARIPRCKQRRRLAQPLLRALPHRCGGCTEPAVAPRLHLAHDQQVAAPRDEVDLAAGDAHVAADDPVAA